MSEEAIVVKKKRGRPRKVVEPVPEAVAELEPQASKSQPSAKPKKTASPTTSRTGTRTSASRTASVVDSSVKEETSKIAAQPASRKAKTGTSTRTATKKQTSPIALPTKDAESVPESPASKPPAIEVNSSSTAQLDAVETHQEGRNISPSEETARSQSKESNLVQDQIEAVEYKATPIQPPKSSLQQEAAPSASRERPRTDLVEEHPVSQARERLGSASPGEASIATAASSHKQPEASDHPPEREIAASTKLATGGPSSSKILSALANREQNGSSPTLSSISKFSTESANPPSSVEAIGAVRMSAKQPPAPPQPSTPSAPATRKPRVVESLARSRPLFPSGNPGPRPLPTRPEDIRQTKEYKIAARKWISTIVALPVLFVTSYMLYERVYGDKSQKHFAKPVEPPLPKDTAHDS